MEGIIVVNKEKGMTSFDVIRELRKILKIRRIGHTGTLDPLAEGVLVICVGRATRMAQDIEAQRKVYVAEMEFGYRTDSYDTEGEIVEKSSVPVTEGIFREVCSKYIGKMQQIPPMYSAIKVNGQKLYDLARKGIEIERKARDIEIKTFEILEFSEEKASIEVEVSKGTYIRSLIYDIGMDLGAFATMSALTRTMVGEHDIKNSYTISQIRAKIEASDFSFCMPVEEYFSFPKLNLQSQKEHTLFKNGNTVVRDVEDGKYRIYFEDEFLGLGKVETQRLKGYKYF